MTRLCMRLSLMFFSICIQSGCSTGGNEKIPHDFRLIINPALPVEKQIIKQYKDLASINASIGDVLPEVIIGKPELLNRLGAIIYGRLNKDLQSVYKNSLTEPADMTYLLLTGKNREYFVRVFRIRKVAPSGAFTHLEGLTYQFLPDGATLAGVYPTHY